MRLASGRRQYPGVTAEVFEQMLAEEKAADAELTQLPEARLNRRAVLCSASSSTAEGAVIQYEGLPPPLVVVVMASQDDLRSRLERHLRRRIDTAPAPRRKPSGLLDTLVSWNRSRASSRRRAGRYVCVHY